MLEVKQAVKLLQENFHRQKLTEVVPIGQSYGRITAADILAPLDIPNFSKAAMDGFAVRVEEQLNAHTQLQVMDTLYAGDAAQKLTAGKNTCVRIMTGAQIPAGFNAVVKKENTRPLETDTIELLASVKAGENFIRQGADLKCGQRVMAAYTRIDSEQIGTLATLGLDRVRVLKKIRVGLVASGNELLSPGESLQPGKIYSSTQYTLASYIERYSGCIVFQELCADDVQSFTDLLQKYKDQVDLIITTGGVSVGDKDFMPKGIEALPAQKIFHYVKIKPGTPMMASVWGNCLILSLSGNPPAAMINFHLFYWPLLALFFNNSQFLLKQSKARLAQTFSKKSKLPRYIRGTLTDGIVSLPKRDQHFSHGIYNCIIVQPPEKILTATDEINVYLLPM